jgi:hypothetical protein
LQGVAQAVAHLLAQTAVVVLVVLEATGLSPHNLYQSARHTQSQSEVAVLAVRIKQKELTVAILYSHQPLPLVGVVVQRVMPQPTSLGLV